MPIIRINYNRKIKQTLPHHRRPATEETPPPPFEIPYIGSICSWTSVINC
ncbi:hypothetical protein HanXRQr2_Chr16g0770121 [Helianthus annuus]|uniref:Uncharacterized protein n=1 Tax=Helianthus annuus TaxID=4232 RepID=A0A9K3DUN4_HELAN|nr:hypothetical protein HanXRQr2_Chr16g0770121 [Helianthus annuus]KAJ0822965.1 hypothetical protein HanPSC8_Chr16g0738191 [Helianthus annuus]